MKKVIKIGTRASPLALAQTDEFVKSFRAEHPDIKVEIVTVATITSGDRIQDKPLSTAGGKGLFTKEIEDDLLDGNIDLAVHSMKDMPTKLPEGLIVPCILPRGDVRDAFFSHKADSIANLPEGATFGTSSLRRQSLVKSMRPDLNIVLLRGNVDSRLRKLDVGEYDATLLAVAGLERLGLMHKVRSIIEPDVILPAVAQGAIGVEIRETDHEMRELLQPLNCKVSELRVRAERAFLDVMDGSCRTPIAGLMSEPDHLGNMKLDVMVARPDGSEVIKGSFVMRSCTAEEAEEFARAAGHNFKKRVPKGFLPIC